MKRLSVFLLVFSLTVVAKAQILKEKIIYLPDSSVLSYLTNQDRISGVYSIKKGKAEIARGNYVDNKRVGNWYFFNKDKSVFLRYNYDVNKLLFVDDKTLATANVVIKSTDAEVATKASVSIPIFSLEQYIILAAKGAARAVPEEDKFRLTNTDVSLTALVSKEGKAQYVVRYEIKGKKYEKKLSLGIDIDWIPASYNGATYDSEFSITTLIPFGTKDQGLHRRFDWL